MGSKTRDAIRWVIAAMIVLVPIMSFIYSIVRYGAIEATFALFAVVFVASTAYFLYTVIRDVKLFIDKVLAYDE